MPLISVFAYGFLDAFNPCNLSTLVFITVILSWLRRGKVPAASPGWVFMVMSFIASLVYSIGVLFNVLCSFPFYLTMRVFYLVVGVVFVWAGIVHLMDWAKLYKENTAAIVLPLLDDGKGKPFSPFLARIILILAAFVFNAFSTVWPSNKYITFYANYLYMPGEFKKTLIMLIVYCAMLSLPMALAPLWISLTSNNGWVSRNMSKAKITISALIMGLGISLIYVFFRATYLE